MNLDRTKAIVLRRTNYGEADRILQLLTPEGKRSVMARGARREKSKLAGGIELFGVSDVVIRKGKSDLATLTSARLVDFYNTILQDYDRMQFAYEVIKQVSKASDMVDEPEWFDLLHETLASLNNMSVSLVLIQTWFYVRYAKLLGYELSLSHDIDGKKLQATARYLYDVGEKGLRSSEKGDITAEHIKLLRLIAEKPVVVVAQVGGVEHIISVCVNTARQHAGI